ncbi:MAG: undecaprenyl-diphosphatase, partial [Solirubrobacteraceae bacterium]|nr:undecaprenyl-diphosphatase [Solirubrobacteraceae bacterium]
MPPAAEPGPPARLRTRDAIALGLLHGPAELLPISSSGHVVLVPWLLGWPYARLDAELRKSFEVALHAGTVAALLVGLRGEVAEGARTLDARGLRVLALSSLPPAVAGLALERAIERRLGSPRGVAGGMIAGSIAMALAGARAAGARGRAAARAADGLALGLAPASALLPGVARNGASLSAARARGVSPRDA